MNRPSGGIFGRETIADGENHALVKAEGACGRPEVTSEAISSGREAFTLDSVIAAGTGNDSTNSRKKELRKIWISEKKIRDLGSQLP